MKPSPRVTSRPRRPPKSLVPASIAAVERLILLLRGRKVLLDADIARLYGVETKALKQAVRRNRDRFPADFMFQLTRAEVRRLRASRSQFVTLKRGENVKYAPYAFTEHGVAMLSSVLRSERAVQVNIAIMRAFARLRELLVTHKHLARRITELERKYDGQFTVVFNAIRKLIAWDDRPRKRVGFVVRTNLIGHHRLITTRRSV